MVMCKIEGCSRECKHYPGLGVCQMHYFRFMRNGSYDLLPRSRKYRRSNPAGYQKIYEPNHPLAGCDGYVYEHRFIIWGRYGKNLPDCEICGKQTNWETCHIDHKDNDVTNNAIENLRPVCRPCNTMRGRKPEHEYPRAKHSLTYNGITGMPKFWSKYPGVKVTESTIRKRIASGMSSFDVLFSPKKTHKTT